MKKRQRKQRSNQKRKRDTKPVPKSDYRDAWLPRGFGSSASLAMAAGLVAAQLLIREEAEQDAS